jgi:type II secretory pathway component PulF
VALPRPSKKANWIPELGLDMIGIGEKSGSLREMLDEVATFYDSEAEVRTGTVDHASRTFDPGN